MFGGLKPSKSSLDRLPKQLGQRWERERIEFEDVLRAQERVPAEAVSMAVSLDGVMVPMKNGQRNVSTTLRHPRAAFSEPRLASGDS